MMKEIRWHLYLMLEKMINGLFIVDVHHITGDKTKFKHFEHYDGGSVRFGNNEPCFIKGKGHISLTKELICDNTYWVEELKHNLLSVEQLNKIGFKVEFMNGKAKLLDKKEIQLALVTKKT